MKLFKLLLLMSILLTVVLSCSEDESKQAGPITVEIKDNTSSEDLTRYVWDDFVIDVEPENSGNVNRVEFSLDAELKFSDYNAPFSYEFDVAGLSYDSHEIIIRAIYADNSTTTYIKSLILTPCPIYIEDLSDIDGITETNINGDILSVDSDDWNFGVNGAVSINPAQPNPTPSTTFIIFENSIFIMSASVIILDAQGNIHETLVVDEEYEIGVHQIDWTGPENQNNIFRLIFHAKDANGDVYHCHGDIEIQ